MSVKAGTANSTYLWPALSATNSPLEAHQPLDVMRQAMYEPATSAGAASRFDEIMAIADPAKRAEAWAEFAKTKGPSAEWHMDQAMDVTNPHRGSGYGGTGHGFVPEFTYGLNGDPLRPGAEMWRIRPDGSSSVVGVFNGRSWQAVIP